MGDSDLRSLILSQLRRRERRIIEDILQVSVNEKWLKISRKAELQLIEHRFLDNASFHNKKRLALLAEKYGHRIVFLPPYSPELNPVEKFWGWLKGKLKKAVHLFCDFNDALWYCFNVI